MGPLSLALAMVLDAALGEPPWLWSRLPHPAVLMGRAVSALDRRLNTGTARRARGMAALALLMIGAAEGFGLIPKGTHHWDDFITPEELDALLDQAGLDMSEPRGIGFSPAKGLHLSGDLSLNYIVTARAR